MTMFSLVLAFKDDLWGFLLFGLIAGLAGMIFQALLWRILGEERLRSIAETVAQLLGVAGMLFALAVGFLVSDTAQKYNALVETVGQEATALLKVYEASQGLPQELGGVIRTRVREYAVAVVDHEWSAMSESRRDDGAGKDFYRLMRLVASSKVTLNTTQGILYQEVLDEMSDALNARRVRLGFHAQSIPDIEWLVLEVTGLVTLLLASMLPFRERVIGQILVFVISITLALNFYLVVAFDRPFSGGLSVSHYPFDHLISHARGDGDGETASKAR